MSNEYCVMCGGHHPLVTNGCPTRVTNSPCESVSPAPQQEETDDPGRCCEAGYFGDSHICLKQPAHPAIVSYGTSDRTMCTAEAMRQNESVAAPQEVKRWELENCGDGYNHDRIMSENPDGDYVLHSDYVSLREELDKMKKIVDWVLQKCDAYPQLAYPVGKSLERPLIQQVQCAMHQVFSVACAKATYERIAKEQQSRAEKAESQLADMRKALEAYADRNSWEWDGDGWKWSGFNGKYDYRVNPGKQAEELLSEVKP